MDNKTKIAAHVLSMLDECYRNADKLVEKALNSGAIDVSGWDEKDKPMLVPKAIVIAILREQANQHDAKGTSYEKQIEKQAKNIQLFL